MNNKIRAIGAIVLVVIWGSLTAFAWFAPAKEFSDSERRPLDQFPSLTVDTLLNGEFMGSFEDFTLDQFPLRDSFRQLKSLFHYYVLNQKDNNDIYIADRYAAKLEYPLNDTSVKYALSRFQYIYDSYLKDSNSKIVMATVPDKGYYLAEKNGYPVMDYDKMFQMVQEGMPWATHVDITDCLDVTDYYYTDTHWRQENIIPVAQKLAQALGVTAPKLEDYTVTKVDRPFYGVYYGQAALPMDAEPLYILENNYLNGCRVFNHENKRNTKVYDKGAILNSKDLYDVYLSGAQALLTIENPTSKSNRELIVFRDSFGSSLTPLLCGDYKSVTVVDIRYMNPALLGNYIDFHGQDVLFCYSTLILNTSATLQ